MATLPKQSLLPLYETEYKRAKNDSRPERNGTLFLVIDVDDQKATIDCREVENVGGGTSRSVIFLAKKDDCTLVFSNPRVFGMKEHPLKEGREEELGCVTEKGWTYCSVKPLDRPTRIPEEFQCPPRIEVP